MSRSLLPGAGAVALALFSLGCSEAPIPTSTMDAAVGPPDAPLHQTMGSARQVLMLDACDPESFNEAFGFEVCTPTSPRAGIHFDTFISLLEKHQKVDVWRFSPGEIRVPRQTTLHLPNKGGIPHSFTEVEEFGGGFVPLLNQLSGNLELAPECVHPENPQAPHPDVRLIAPGDYDEVTVTPGDGTKYMCCIHPWMRATVH